jgi:hypothetical protein
VIRTEKRTVTRLMGAAQREVDEGRTPACRLALAHHGKLIAVRASALSDLATTCAQGLS